MKMKIVVGGVEVWKDMGPAVAPSSFLSLQLSIINVAREEIGLEPVQDIPTKEALVEDLD